MTAPRVLRVLPVVVALLLCLAGNATATQLLITLDEYGTALLTRDGVTSRLLGGHSIAGGGVGYPWEQWGLGGDIVSGSLLLVDENGNVSDVIIFDNLNLISFYSDGTDGIDSPADTATFPPFPPFSLQERIAEIGPEGNNGTFYFAPALTPQPGSLRGFDTLYHFVSDGRLPVPASLLLLVSGFVVLVGMKWNRSARGRRA